MNKHHKLNCIASLLDQPLEEARQCVQEVNQTLPSRMSYGKIYHAAKGLPSHARTVTEVATYLLETEHFIGGPYREHKPNTPITKHHDDSSAYRQREITTKVVGVTFDGRQAMVAKLTMHEEIVLRREPMNPYDHNAIRVERLNGEQIGYINRYLAASLAPTLDAIGEAIHGTVCELSGGGSYCYSLGLDIKFTVPNTRTNGRLS